MPKLNLQQRLCLALEQRGERRVEARTTKYIVFTRTYAGLRDANGALVHRPGGLWFVGKAGALRFGMQSTGSLAANDRVKAELLAEVTQ